jgi:DNA-binding transcriptional LysR family regulator
LAFPAVRSLDGRAACRDHARNNGILMRDAALDGMGIALLSTFFFHDLLARKKLRVVDVGAEAEPATIAYPNDRRVSAKVLALIAHLRATFGSPPYWDQ